MNATECLILSGLDGAAVSTAALATARRDELLRMARAGSAIHSAPSAALAGEVLTEIKGYTRLIEDARKTVKAQPLDLCRRIDELAATLTSDLENESHRIARLLGGWQAEQNRLAELARREAWEREQAITREANEKAAAEKKRIADEAAALEAKADRARSPERADALRAQAAGVIAQGEAASIAHVEDVETAIAETRVAAATKPSSPAGISTRAELKFEVIDVLALYEAAPAFVILAPNNAAIKAALKALPAGQSLPGVKHWIEHVSVVSGRAGA